jgi:hypothetical protein
MDELINKVVDQLGIDENITRRPGMPTSILKSHVGRFRLFGILTKLKGAEALIKVLKQPLPGNTARSVEAKVRSFRSLVLKWSPSWLPSWHIEAVPWRLMYLRPSHARVSRGRAGFVRFVEQT